MDTEGFIERYRQAFEEGDSDWIAGVYDLPMPVIRPDRKIWLEDARALKKNLARIHDTWIWSGMRRVSVRVREDSIFKPGLIVVHVGWRLHDADNDPLCDIDVTYILEPVAEEDKAAAVDPRFRIVGIVAHNEEDARDPIIADGAPKEHYA